VQLEILVLLGLVAVHQTQVRQETLETLVRQVQLEGQALLETLVPLEVQAIQETQVQQVQPEGQALLGLAAVHQTQVQQDRQVNLVII